MLIKKLCLGIIALVLGGAMAVSPVFAAEEPDGLTNENVTVLQGMNMPEESAVFGYYNSIAYRHTYFNSRGGTYRLNMEFNCDTDSSTGYIRSVSLGSYSSNLPTPFYTQVTINSLQRTDRNSFTVILNVDTKLAGVKVTSATVTVKI